MLSFDQALNIVKETLAAAHVQPEKETVPIGEALGRVLADDVTADRDYPPFNRSIRDGFALRANDVATTPVALRLRGEVRAGGQFAGTVGTGECVAIMTGAPLPAGADAVVMVEYTESLGEKVNVQRRVLAGENIVAQGSEARAGACVLLRGCRLGAGESGLLAAVGQSQVPVFVRPVVAILPTGDEIVPVEHPPRGFKFAIATPFRWRPRFPWQRHSPVSGDCARSARRTSRFNSARAGRGPAASLRWGFGGQVRFRRAGSCRIGSGVLFSKCGPAARKTTGVRTGRGKFFFGLPGNRVSTFVTFALFARPAIATLSGAAFTTPGFLRARLGQPLRPRAGLTAFVPARLQRLSGEPAVHPVRWQGWGTWSEWPLLTVLLFCAPSRPV